MIDLRVFAMTGLLAFLLNVILVQSALQDGARTIALEPNRIGPLNGSEFFAPLPRPRYPRIISGDSTVTENGVVLPAGRSSALGGATGEPRIAVFAAPDGGDPRSNGKIYKARVNTPLAPLFLVLVVLSNILFAALLPRLLQHITIPRLPAVFSISYSSRLARLALLLFVLDAAVLGLYVFRPTLDVSVDSAEISPIEKLAFSIPVQGSATFPYAFRPDTNGAPYASKLILYENGKPLAQRHVIHQSIVDEGMGRYSHWGSAIVFSSSDGSDPRYNGKSYRFVAKAHLSRIVILLPLALTAAFMLVLFTYLREREHKWIFALTVLGVFAYLNIIFVFNAPVFALLAPDTGTYLTFDNLGRTIGYALIINAAFAFSGDLAAMLPIQLNAMLLAFALLAWSTGRLMRSSLVAVLTMLGLSFSFSAVTTAMHVLTEPPFVTLIAIYLAAVFQLIVRFSWRWSLLAGACLALAILVRPAGYSLVGGIVLLMIWADGARLKILASQGGVLATAILLASALNFYKSNVFATQVFTGTTLLGIAGQLVRENPDSAYPELWAELAKTLEPIVGDTLSQPWPRERWLATQNTFNRILHAAAPVITKAAQRATKNGGGAAYLTTYNEMARTISTEALLSNPMEYLKIATASYYGMWSGMFVNLGTIARMRYDYYLFNRKHLWEWGAEPIYRDWTPLGFFKNLDIEKFFQTRASDLTIYDRVHQYITRFGLPLRVLFAGLSLFVVFWALIQLYIRLISNKPANPAIFAMAFVALQIQGYFVLVSLANTALVRFSQVMEPFLVLVAVMIASYLGSLLCQRYALFGARE